jgi:hypothetical protein
MVCTAALVPPSQFERGERCYMSRERRNPDRGRAGMLRYYVGELVKAFEKAAIGHWSSLVVPW